MMTIIPLSTDALGPAMTEEEALAMDLKEFTATLLEEQTAREESSTSRIAKYFNQYSLLSCFIPEFWTP